MQRFRLSFAVDVDDVLFECIPYALKLANEKYGFEPPIRPEEVTQWGITGQRTDVIFEYFEQMDFYETQPVIEGAKEFIKKLCDMAEVFINTAIEPQFMGIRAKRIMEEFPEIRKENIIMSSRKDRISTDIIWDDGVHNVLKTTAAYPILCRRPWNQQITGILATNRFDEVLQIVREILYGALPRKKPEGPQIIVLVGPSGAGKTQIARMLPKDQYRKPVSTTTRKRRDSEAEDAYHFVERDEFERILEEGGFFEHSVYAGCLYGTKKEDFDVILEQGLSAVVPMDISGAMALKLHYDNCITIYVDRPKRELLENIIKRNVSTDEKIRRILSLDAEEKNQDLCDYRLENNKDADLVAQDLQKLIKGE